MINLNDIITYGNAKFKVVKTATSEDINYIKNNLLPIGTVLSYSSNNASPPICFLFCDGSAISRTTYSELFNLIGTTYGVGDESTTFNLPNLINKFIEGYATSGTNIDAGLPNITGAFGAYAASVGSCSGAIVAWSYSQSSYAFGGSGIGSGFQLNAARSSSIYGNSTTVQPPALTMKYIIKAYTE